MPELPEVQTTVNGLNTTVKGRRIVDVWTDYKSTYKAHRESVKDEQFYKEFKKKVVGQKILKTERRAKNILMHLGNGYTLLTHMKMTGYFVYDRPEEKFVHFRLTLDNGKTLGFSDMRKFGKITVVKTDELETCSHLEYLGPEPLDKSFTCTIFKKQLAKKPRGKIKTVLMDQSVIAGIGNIYSDEILWRASVHPLSTVGLIPEKNLKLMFTATKETLKKGIDFGGDSMSDYRNIKGERGKFQDHHRAYRRKGKSCTKPRCTGVITRLVVGTRSAHFCPIHQKLFT